MAYDKVFSALADPTRRRIFESLRGRSRSVGEIASKFPISRPAVSQHLKVLGAAGLTLMESQGTRRIYSVRREGLRDLQVYLESFWSDALLAYAAEIDRKVKKS